MGMKKKKQQMENQAKQKLKASILFSPLKISLNVSDIHLMSKTNASREENFLMCL